MTLSAYLAAMPKVELHVHLEGSIRPETVLALAQRHGVALPANDLPGLRAWYAFTDFPHFVDVYLAVSACLRTPDDIELITREFLAGQAAQNIRYSEVTYTAFTHYATKGLSFADQLAAINRARDWGRQALGVDMGLVIDIDRMTTAEQGLIVAGWAIAAHGDGVVALGLGGPEVGNPPERFAEAFARARAAGLPRVPHAGETEGPASIWGALNTLHADRLGHAVRCLEDPVLVAELRDRQISLDVNPTSNVCLHVVPSFGEHMLPRLLAEGLYVTLNSDDPPMFNTTLTHEYQQVSQTFGLGAAAMEGLVLNAVRASLLPAAERARLEAEFTAEFARLRAVHLPAEPAPAAGP